MTDASQRYGFAAGGSTRPFELTDTSMTEGAFFEIDTPVVGSISDDNAVQTFSESESDSDSAILSLHSRDSNMNRSSNHNHGSTHHSHKSDDSDTHVENGGGPNMMRPRPEIVLRWKRFMLALLASITLVVGLTIVFYIGIVVREVREPVGDSTESEKLLRRYNTYSGVSMGIFEAFLGLGFAHFFPAFTVYVHNLKWWPGDDPSAHKTSKPKKVLLMLFFPVVMVAVGNSFSAFQAAASTTRLELFMDAASLMRNVSDLAYPTDALSNSSYVRLHEETVLKTAVLRQATPFAFVPSNCMKASVAADANDQLSAYKRMTDLDATSVVFGFPLKEWSREVYPQVMGSSSTSTPFSNASLPLDVSFELLFQGQAFIERWVASLPDRRCRYTAATDATVCNKRKRTTTLPELYGYLNGTKTRTAAALATEALAGLQNAFFHDLDATSVRVASQTIALSPQLTAQMLSIELDLAADFEFGIAGETTVTPTNCSATNTTAAAPAACEYQYEMVDMDAFCGESACVIPDWQADTIPRKQAAMMQYKRRCIEARATRDTALPSVIVPGGCEDVPNTVFVAAFGSMLNVETFAMRVNKTTGRNSTVAYAKNPRRTIRLTVGKLAWTVDNVATPFRATCDVGDSDGACRGLTHTLRPSGRVVVLGEQFVPTAIAASTFAQPIALFQLLQPAILSPRAEHAVVVPEVVSPTTGVRSRTGSTTLPIAKTACSALVDAFIAHVAANEYTYDGSFQPLYISAMLYLFQNAAVTKVRATTTTTATGASSSTASALRLTGDRAVHKILIQNTTVGVYTVWTGCIILVLLAVVVLVVPNERARLTPMAGKNARAERFVAVQTEEVYPNLVYMKRFRIGKTGEALKLSEFAVESVTLHHRMEDDDEQLVL